MNEETIQTLNKIMPVVECTVNITLSCIRCWSFTTK